jgi:serine protease inhibitor
MARHVTPQDEHARSFSPEVANVNRLSLAFAKAVAAGVEDKNDNVLISPYNALTFLAMAGTGAVGKTKKEYAEVLFGTTPAKFTAEVGKLAALNASVLKANDGKVTLKTANGLWVNSRFGKVKPGYEADLKRVFGAEVSDKDFGLPKTKDDINQWGSDNTNHLIDKFLGELSADDRAILASALYYKGDWTNKFDRKLTEAKPFHIDGETEEHKTPMMHKVFKEGDVSYHSGNDYEAIALTYGKKDYKTQPYQTPSMRILLVRPSNEVQTARDWLLSQDEKTTPAWVDPYAYRSALGTVELPHMDMEQDHDLIPVLKKLGLETAFSGAANYSNIATGGVGFTAVKQKIVFKTGEDGSEGASITHGAMKTTAMRQPPPKIDIHFDRSFVFALQDIESGAILFTGIVNKPNKEMTPAAPAPSA